MELSSQFILPVIKLKEVEVFSTSFGFPETKADSVFGLVSWDGHIIRQSLYNLPTNPFPPVIQSTTNLNWEINWTNQNGNLEPKDIGKTWISICIESYKSYLRSSGMDFDVTEKSDWEHNVVPDNFPRAKLLKNSHQM